MLVFSFSNKPFLCFTEIDDVNSLEVRIVPGSVRVREGIADVLGGALEIPGHIVRGNVDGALDVAGCARGASEAPAQVVPPRETADIMPRPPRSE